METIKEKAENLAEMLTEKYGFREGDCEANRTTFLIEEGRKYLKILRSQISSRSAYAFIDKNTGDIFKPASWAAPAKHARGNVNNPDKGLGCCERYSIIYLR